MLCAGFRDIDPKENGGFSTELLNSAVTKPKGKTAMATIPQIALFTWKEIEHLGDLSRLKLVLESMPDESLMRKLEAKRGNGRDDYPIRAIWNSLLAGIVFQHASVESLRRELKRNAQLCWVCGFELSRGDKMVPEHWVYTRFLKSLMDHSEAVAAMFENLVDQLRKELPDFGHTLAIDGKAVQSRARGKTKGCPDDRRGDHDADWGVKQYFVNKADGSAERKVKRWFGFKVHTVVDAKYELPIAFDLTKASAAEQPVAHDLIKSLKQTHPSILKHCEYLTADRGYDDGKLHERLWKKHNIKPVIGIRNLWKAPEGFDGTRAVSSLNGVAYDFEGNVYCYNVYGHRQKMAHAGFEAKRNAIKYRCPKKHYGLKCAGSSQCEISSCVRIPIREDRRIFGPVARDGYKWSRIYKSRTAVERVYSRLDTSFGFENHTTRGADKMHLRVSMAYMAMLAMALGRIKQKQHKLMRSLVQQAA